MNLQLIVRIFKIERKKNEDLKFEQKWNFDIFSAV